MTHSTTSHSTITKETETTNVSSFELSGENKNESPQSEVQRICPVLLTSEY